LTGWDVYLACVSSTVPISQKKTEQRMSVSSVRSEIFIEKILPFDLQLLTELEESKGGG
jgi:hypothetical protein